MHRYTGWRSCNGEIEKVWQIGKRSYKRLANSSTQRSLLRNDGRMCRRRKGPTGLEETEREEKGRREEQVTSGFEHRL